MHTPGFPRKTGGISVAAIEQDIGKAQGLWLSGLSLRFGFAIGLQTGCVVHKPGHLVLNQCNGIVPTACAEHPHLNIEEKRCHAHTHIFLSILRLIRHIRTESPSPGRPLKLLPPNIPPNTAATAAGPCQLPGKTLLCFVAVTITQNIHNEKIFIFISP